MNDYTLRHICSCCSSHVTAADRKLPNNDDSEGNLCARCYGEQELDNWFRMQELFDKVFNAFKNPIHKLKWQYHEPYVKWHYCEKMMNAGIITWGIN